MEERFWTYERLIVRPVQSAEEIPRMTERNLGFAALQSLVSSLRFSYVDIRASGV